MSKQRYNILRLALGTFIGISIGQLVKDPNALNTSELIALGVGLFAAVVNYWPERKDVKPEDRS